MNKICPIMSIAHPDCAPKDPVVAFCQEDKCRLWIEVFSATELTMVQGCVYELQPRMVDGQLRDWRGE